MGSKITFWPMRTPSFALRTDCLPACKQSLHKLDWSILLCLQTGSRMSNECPSSIDLAFTLKEIRYYVMC